MVHCGSDYVVESYKDYRNRAVTKQLDKLKNALSGIKQCSLHVSDKKNLLDQMQQLIEDARQSY
jgi:prefoldin subunit 5